VFKYCKVKENVPKYEGKPKVSPARISFETFATMSLLSLMIDKQKIIEFIKAIATFIAIMCGIIIWAYLYYTTSWFG